MPASEEGSEIDQLQFAEAVETSLCVTPLGDRVWVVETGGGTGVGRPRVRLSLCAASR
jgi:hypothetical protein